MKKTTKKVAKRKPKPAALTVTTVKVSKETIVEVNTELDELVQHRNVCKAMLEQANKAIAEKKAFYKKELEKN